MSRTTWRWAVRSSWTSRILPKTASPKSGRFCRKAAMQLVILRGHPAQTFLLASGEGIIGRTPGSTIELQDPQVSRQHCRVIWDGRTLTIEDLGSARGTFLNGTR